MATEDWKQVSYAKNSALPLRGEIIITRFSFHDVDFKYGPNSHYAPSSHYSYPPPNASSSNSSQTRLGTHHLLVLDVVKLLNNISLKVLPIVSYHSSPKERTSPSGWDADRWMTQQASVIQRLHHLPIPAVNWAPSLPPSSDAPILSFGSWENSRPSWVAMFHVTHSINIRTKWRRHNDPVILDGGEDAILGLYGYLDNVIPLMIEEINATAIIESTRAPIDSTNTANIPSDEDLVTNTTNSDRVIHSITENSVGPIT